MRINIKFPAVKSQSKEFKQQLQLEQEQHQIQKFSSTEIWYILTQSSTDSKQPLLQLTLDLKDYIRRFKKYTYMYIYIGFGIGHVTTIA